MQKLKTKRSAARALSVFLADTPELITQAQRLRFDVFCHEYGAKLDDPNQLDRDQFDPFCHHLIVFNTEANEIAATTRILTDENAIAAGKFYSETEFDITNIKQAEGRIMEIGRTCVNAKYRNGATLSLLWSGIAQFFLEHKYDYLIGCGSISMRDGGLKAWSITEHLKKNFLADEKFIATPHRSIPTLANQEPEEIDGSEVPSLIKAYMRLGAKVCGDPCWDPDFKCADLLILLDVKNLSPRYKKHFFKLKN